MIISEIKFEAILIFSYIFKFLNSNNVSDFELIIYYVRLIIMYIINRHIIYRIKII